MVIAAGASAKSQQALGTGVMGGMIAVVVLALLMVPVFFVAVQSAFNRTARQDMRDATDMAAVSDEPPAADRRQASRAHNAQLVSPQFLFG